MTESMAVDGSYIIAKVGLADAMRFEHMSEVAYRTKGENNMLVNSDNPISLFEKGFTESEAKSRVAVLNEQRVHEINLGIAASARKILGSPEDAPSFAGGAAPITPHKELQAERQAA